MKTKIKYGAIVRCDADVNGARCEERFQSNSFQAVVRQQTLALGWGRVPSWQVPSGHNGSKLHDVCPTHKAIADTLAADREVTLEAQREQKKAEKQAEQAERDTARAAKKAAQIAKTAEIAKRKADHAARLALLQQQKQEKRARLAAKKGVAPDAG